MKKNTEIKTAETDNEKKLLSSKEAAAYLGIDYCNFRKQRNKGYFGHDKYPAPKFINIGTSFQGIRYRTTDLDKWLLNFPGSTSTEKFFSDKDPQKNKL
jgi:hypothetical protein